MQTSPVLNIHRASHTTHCSLFTVLCSLFIVFFLSCQTAPKTPDTVSGESEFVPLNPGASTYLFVDVKNARPILDAIDFKGMNDKQIKQILDRTRSMAAAIYPPDDARSYHLSAWGRYPAQGGKLAFGSSKDWKKMSSPTTGADYWYSENGHLSIALDADHVFVSANKTNVLTDTNIDPFPIAPGTKIPEHFNTFRKGAIVSCWFKDPASMIGQKLEEAGIGIAFPAEQLFISLYPVLPATKKAGEPLYEAILRMQFSNARLARNITGILDFTRNHIADSITKSEADTSNFAALASLFFANPPEHEGNSLIIKTGPLKKEDIALLFGSFSLW